MSSHTLIKICGNTSIEDARMAALAGADYLGVIVEHKPSPRHTSLAQARAIFAATDCPTTAVTVNLSLDQLLQIADTLQPAALQLHGDESIELVRQLKARSLTVWVACAGGADGDEAEVVRQRALAVTESGADAVLVDARVSGDGGTIYGGTGEMGDWHTARELVDTGVRVILAGGLDAGNVAEAVQVVRPWMVDVVSGVEGRKGVKDPHKVHQFIEAARAV